MVKGRSVVRRSTWGLLAIAVWITVCVVLVGVTLDDVNQAPEWFR